MTNYITAAIGVVIMATTANGQINTGKDVIPDFGVNPTHTTIKDGYWHDPAIWDNGLPGPDAIVRIATLVELLTEVEVHTVGISGTLACSESEITCVNVLIYEEGKLTQFGPNELIFRDVPPTDPLQFGTGLICLGCWEAIGSGYGTASGPPDRYGYHGDLKPGTSSLEIPDCLVGDRLAFADSRPQVVYNELDYYQSSQCEERVITAVNGNTCSFDPLKYFHSRFTPVAYLTCDTVIRSENPSGNRGHVMITGHATFDLRGVTFRDLGRTKAAPLGQGTNQIGRYSLHVHHVHDGTQSIISQCAIDGGLRWGLAIHGTNGLTVLDNVIYNCHGAGVAIEDGSETNNIISGNYVLKVTGTPGMSANQRSEEASQRQGNGFWIQGLNNKFVDNIAANCRAGGYNLFRAHGHDTSVRNPPSNVFTAPPMGWFEDNAAMCSAFGVETWMMQGNVVRITNLNCYNCMRGFRLPFVTDNVEIHGLSYNCDKISGDTRYAAMALDIDGGYVRTLKARNVYVKQADYGLFMREMAPASLHLSDSHFENTTKGVYVQPVMSGIENPHMTKEITLRSVSYSQCPDPVSILTGAVQARHAPLQGAWRIIVLDHDDKSYELFLPEQHANAMVPAYFANPIPFYGTGKSNQQSWNEDSIAIGMQVAPEHAVSGEPLGFRNLLAAPYKPQRQFPPLRVMAISYQPGPLWVAVLGDRMQVDTLQLIAMDGTVETYTLAQDQTSSVAKIATKFQHRSGDKYGAMLLKDGRAVAANSFTVR